MGDQSKEQIRRRMLTAARINGPQFAHGFVPASQFVVVKDDEGNGCTEDEAVDLLGDLVAWGLLEEFVGPALGGNKPGLRHRRFKLTDKGWRLWNGEIPPIVGVADERLGD